MQLQNPLSQSADKAAIGLSLLCTLHCLLLPVAVALLPSLALFGLEDELFHQILLVVVLPISAFALWSGLRKHSNGKVLALGVAGMVTLVITAVIGHDVFGESGERLMTVLGSLLVASSHFRNYQLCQLHSSNPAS